MERGQQEAISKLMSEFRAGDSQAAGQLIEMLYPELKRMAESQMRQEWRENSWQPTLLVNVLYLEVMKIRGLPGREGGAGDDKAAFLALAARVMKRLLIHHARPLSRKANKVPIDDAKLADSETSIVEVEDMLSRIGEVKPEIRAVVELKVFQGLTADEIAERMGCAPITVHRHWSFARKWLEKELVSI
jgi:RNA polymerase sigma factor (TIGR02999 family)